MKSSHLLILALIALGRLQPQAADLKSLKLLYVGDPGSERAKQFTRFLTSRVDKFTATGREGFKTEQAASFDVVVLDWPQGSSTQDEWRRPSPLGDRAQWKTPTVLLGSAGLNLAVVWKVRGGSG
jgi:hypothetical protein